MSDRPNLPTIQTRTAAAPPFQTTSRCWYRFFGLGPTFQRFIIPDLDRYASASCVLDREVYVATELLHLHAAVDTDWFQHPDFLAPVTEIDPANARAPRSTPELAPWWPLAKLEAGFIRFLFTDLAEDPSQSKVIDGTLYVARELVASYAAGDTDWLYEETSSCEPISTMSL